DRRGGAAAHLRGVLPCRAKPLGWSPRARARVDAGAPNRRGSSRARRGAERARARRALRGDAAGGRVAKRGIAPGAGGGDELVSQRILVIEDDPNLVEGLRSALVADGYDVETATDGHSGFARARDGGFALLVLDVMLPGMSGFEIATRLRDERRSPPFILLTA